MLDIMYQYSSKFKSQNGWNKISHISPMKEEKLRTNKQGEVIN